MFETTVVESKRKKRSARALLGLPASIALHSVAVGGVFFVLVTDLVLPTMPPAQVALYSIVQPPPPPPPPPKPPEQPKIVPIHKTMPFVAPTKIPDFIPEVQPEEPPVEYASLDGVEGGVAGGVQGGVAVVDAPSPPPPPPPVDPNAPLDVGGDVKEPTPLDAPAPDYPQDAFRLRLEGSVRLEIIIDPRGRVDSANVLSSTNPIFEKAAMDIVKTWRFDPARRAGKPVLARWKLTLRFEIIDHVKRKS